ncbi:MAG: hypothetical protein ABMA64_22915 [Myxococcota bacterium]
MLLLTIGVTWGQELPCVDSRDGLACDYQFCLAYQQPAYDPHDPVSEACTWAMADHRRVRRFTLAMTGRLDVWLLGDFLGDKLAGEEAYPEQLARFPRYDQHVDRPARAWVSEWMEGRTAPIDVDAALAMFDQVVIEESRAGIDPRAGEVVVWSRAFHRHHPMPQFNRMLVTLTFGASSRLMRTGHEEVLLDWLLAQPDGSVTLEGLWRTAYRAADGDLYLALLTAENVLSRYFLDPDRDRLVFAQKLRPLVDTYQNRGDNFGAWYHLFGMAVYTYAQGPTAGFVSSTAETLGSKFSNRGREVEVQEGYANRAGSRIGLHLRRRITGEGWAGVPDDPAALSEAAYMDLDQFFPDDRPE